MPRVALVLLSQLLLLGGAWAADWPQFRGPDGQGHSEAANLPLTWSESENIAWKVPIEGLGWSSPSIQGDEIWLTTAVDGGKQLKVVKLDRATGRALKEITVFELEDPGRIHSKNSHASPTALIQGDKVYVHFGAHGTACLTRDGEVVWKTKMEYAHRHGPGGSPILWQDLLIMSCDGTDVQYVVALDKTTGQVRWKQDRLHISEKRLTKMANVPMAYTTPLLVEVNGVMQLLSTGSDSLVSYEPRTGRENWWFSYFGYSNVPRPVVAGGMAFISSGYDKPEFFAVRIDGAGDVTESHLVWNMKKAAPLNPSPLVVGNEIYVISDNGILTCLDISSGEQHYQQRIGGAYSASPTLADGRIWLLDEDGTSTVFKPGKEYEELGTSQLEGRTLATPAFLDQAIYLRTDTHLYRIEKRG